MGISVPKLEIKYLLRTISLLIEFRQMSVVLPLEINNNNIWYFFHLNTSRFLFEI